jgi:NADH-quinone oxidoreductase subunit G
MAEIFIDNQRFEYSGNVKVLRFIQENGLELPSFCYHPSLSIPANCRQCYVEAGMPVFNRETNAYDLDENGERIIRWFPKLMTACNMDAADGMVVKTHKTSELVRRGQKDVLEFILINHPLDCPICDQAGECPLQEQTYKYGPEGSRFEHKKVHKPKRIQLGPRVILDAERCINCTRCVRFTEEISKTNQLTIVARGDHNYPSTAPGREFDDAYSLNTVDICPVGALTSADFRFKARVWEMASTPSIDITNGKGCSVDLWTRDDLVLRITPRHNPHVNDYWMPDSGRTAYTIYNEQRVNKPQLALDGTAAPTSWTNAVLTVHEKIAAAKSDQILIVASAHASVEDNFALSSYFAKSGKGRVVFTPHIVEGAGDGFLLTDDQAPNTSGVRMLGIEEVSASDLADAVKSAKLVLILNDDLVGRGALKASDLKKAFVVALASNHNSTTAAADLVVPITTAAEHVGTYVNVDGRAQRTIPAKATTRVNRSVNLEMSKGRLDHFGTHFDNWVSDKNRIDCIPAWEFLSNVAAEATVDVAYSDARDVLADITSTVPAFSGLTYERMDQERGVSLLTELTHA